MYDVRDRKAERGLSFDACEAGSEINVDANILFEVVNVYAGKAMVAPLSGKALNIDRASSSVGGAFRTLASGARARKPRKTNVLFKFHPSGRSSKMET